MKISFDEILSAVRDNRDAGAAFNSLCRIANLRLKSALWTDLPTPNFEIDIWEAAAWIGAQIDIHKPVEVCFTLLTPNSGLYQGKNASMSLVVPLDPELPDQGRVRYSDGHQIKGLVKLRSAYKRKGETESANYIFFLGYGGAVLSAAIERVHPRQDCLFIWGIGDGPFCKLAKASPSGIERLVTMQGA